MAMQGQEAVLRPHPPSRGITRQQLAHSLVQSIPPRTTGQFTPSLSGGGAGRGVGRGTRPHPSLRKQLSADAVTKMAISPPVCGVQPGRVLSLRTTMGLRQARAILAQQQQQHDMLPADSALGNSRATRAQLKQARLQPLGVVDTDVLRPDNLLGVVPVTSIRTRPDRRPKSCTAPGTQEVRDLRAEDHALRQVPDVMTKAARKRSYSAVLPRHIPDNTLRQLLNISRHTALPPQQEPAEDTSVVVRETNTLPDTSDIQAEFIKVNLRGVKKSPPPREGSYKPLKHSRAKSQDNLRQSQIRSQDKPTPTPPVQGEKFPNISDSPRALHEEDNTSLTLSITVTRSRATSAAATKNSTLQHHDELTQHPGVNDTSERPRPLLVSPVREGKWMGRTTHKTRQLPSAKGRLSQGWSPPQPIEPIRGSPIHSPLRGTGMSAGTKEGKVINDPVLANTNTGSPTASMVINLNVNEVLTQADSEVTEQ